MLSPEIVKTIVLFVLLLLTFLLGVIPIKLVRVVRKRSASTTRPRDLRSVFPSDGSVVDTRPRYKRVISFLSCFAAGVFLATCLLDLLPDVRRVLMNVLDDMKIYTGFPVAEFVMVLGLFAILITEQIVLTVKERHPPPETNNSRTPLLADDNWPNSASRSICSEHAIEGISDIPYLERSDSHTSDLQREDVYQAPTSVDGSDHQHHHHDHSSHDISDHPHSPLRAFLLLIALSLHSIFEGLAVGLQRQASDVLGIFAALVIHKSILSFSLGMNLVQTNLSMKSMIRSILLFSVTAPIGVAIGIGIIDLWESVVSNLVQGLLQGVACGTFLYITFFEVLPHEFNSHHDRILKLLFLLLGYGAVTGVLFLSDDVLKPFCPIAQNNETQTG